MKVMHMGNNDKTVDQTLCLKAKQTPNRRIDTIYGNKPKFSNIAELDILSRNVSSEVISMAL
ncbi:hypothetical protein BCT27_24205 [Enterovibrio norvegicus]|nr:hypothetical protein BCT27_24205 [Enterovibrio norvegicus]